MKSLTARRRKTLLLVEDATTGGPIREALGQDYRIRLAPSGEEALKQAARLPHLDAALVDIRLPGMSGLEFCRRLREGRPDVKIFLMTPYSAAAEAFAVGAEGCLTQPFSMETLRDMLLSHLGFSAL